MADADNHYSVPRLPPFEVNRTIESQEPAQQVPVVRFTESTLTTQHATTHSSSAHSPPPRVIASYPSTTSDGSLSSVTNNTTPNRITTAAISSRQGTTSAAMSPATPDFSRPQSDANAYLSGDDEDEWDREAEMVMESISKIGTGDDTADHPSDMAYEEVNEMDELLREVEEDEAEGGEVEYETITVTMKTYSVAELKEVAKRVSVVVGGNKSALFARIRDSGSEWVVKGDSDESFEYKKEKSTSVIMATDPNAPYWVVLNPEIPPPIAGVDMRTGASIGFFGPTNTNNIVGAQRHNFLAEHPSDKIQRPVFVSIDPTRPTQENGGPSVFAMKSIGDIKNARPIDFFHLIITPRFVEKTMVACTNQKAASEGAGVGGTVYNDFVQFDVNEMYRFLGLLFANGLSPKPDITKWFEICGEDPLLGSDFIAPLMNKKLPRSGVVPGIRRWKHFRRFLCFYDFQMVTRQSVEADPLWKVRLLLKTLNKQSMAMWIPGKHVSVDEQTIAFKGKSSMKLRISYKKEGDGFQCDALCDRGYTFAFYFRHGEPPKLHPLLDDLKLPPTARRVVWLAQQLPNYWTRIYMDNLFNSQKLFSALYRVKALAHGVMRTSGRGFPPSVKQDEEKNANKADALKGTTKAAILKNSADTPDMIAVSVYDNKPVHLMSTVCEKVEWVEKKRKVWCAAARANQMMSHMRLNLIDDYNKFMNSTDIADQLRNTYRPDHWMRNRKWWWSIFIWAIGVARVNAYKLYFEMYDDAKRMKEKGLPPKWSHREFIHELIFDLMSFENTMSKKRSRSSCDNTDEDKSEGGSSTARSTRGSSSLGQSVARSNDSDDVDDFECESGIADALRKYKPVNITTQRMENNFFTRRFDGTLHPNLPAEGATCQYCRYQYRHVFTYEQCRENAVLAQNRKHVRRCLKCNVNLCPPCELEFHGVKTSDLGQYFRGK